MTRGPRLTPRARLLGTPRREPGQILILTAIFLVVLMVLGGSAYDYGSIVAEDLQLQNAADSAGLAGSNALTNAAMLPVDTAIAIAEATSREYLRINGYETTTPGVTISYEFPTSTPFVAGGTPGSIRDNIVVTVNKVKPTFFWLLVGVNNVNINATSGATASRGLVDVMLTLDTTGSMGPAGIAALQAAVRDFVFQMNPSTANPRGPRIGIARFQGLGCVWWRGTDGGPPGDGDGRIDIDSSSATNEYREPCTDQQTLLTSLTPDRAMLIKIADNTPAGFCPVATALGACPINQVPYTAPVAAGHGTAATPEGLSFDGVDGGSPPVPGGTGTKLDAGLTAVSRSGFYAWDCANGGRNDCAGEGWAQKVLVYMTDGDNNLANPHPLTLASGIESTWDTEFVAESAVLELGPDGSPGTNDDVEIYVVGYFDPGTISLQADTPSPHPCPGPLPAAAQRSSIDDLLITVSSSAAGTCDHYFPLQKTESLPAVFQVLASKISRAKLTE